MSNVSSFVAWFLKPKHSYCFRDYLINCKLIIFSLASMLCELALDKIVLQFCTKLAEVQSYNAPLCPLACLRLPSDMKNWDPDVVVSCSKRAHLPTSILSPSDTLTVKLKASSWLCVCSVTASTLQSLLCVAMSKNLFIFCSAFVTLQSLTTLQLDLPNFGGLSFAWR